MTDYSKMTPEQLEQMKARGGDGKGISGTIKSFIDPAGRKQADAATAELDKRRKEAEAAAAAAEAERKRQAEIKKKAKCDITAENPAGICFNKKGGKIEAFAKGGMVRGDGAAQRGKTKGRMC